jgi:hypothetical protein
VPVEELLSNTKTTTVAVALSAGGTSLTVAAASGFPAAATGVAQFRARLGNPTVPISLELVLVTNVAGAVWTITRGIEGTTAVSHPVGHAVTLVATAGALENLVNVYSGDVLTATTRDLAFDAGDFDVALTDGQAVVTRAGTPSTVANDPLFDAVGDLAAGTGVDAAGRLPVGTDGQLLQADSGQATGLVWVDPAAGAAFDAPSGVVEIGAVAAEGVATTTVRSDHVHPVVAPAAGYPLPVAAAEDDGTSALAARADHAHAHGTGYLPDAHHTQSHDHAGAGDGTALAPASLHVTAGPVRFAGDISPTQLTANVNDWSPTGLASAAVIRFSTDATRNVTGLAGGADGRLLVLMNVGAQQAVLVDDSASSAAANRFALDGSLTLLGDTAATLLYDATSSRWRLLGVGKTTAPLSSTFNDIEGDPAAVVATAAADGASAYAARRDHVHAHGTGYAPDAHHAQAHNHTTGDSSGVLTDDEHDGFSQYVNLGSDPSTPAANRIRLYSKDNGAGVSTLYYRSESGDVYELPTLTSGGGGSGAPANATFVTLGAESKLSQETVLGSGVIMAGVAGSRPAFGTAGRLYWTTDTFLLYRDTGAAWTEIARGEAATRLNSLAEKAYSSLTYSGLTAGHVLTATGTTSAAFQASSTTPASTVQSETAYGVSPSVGAATVYARGDHTHGTPSDPALDFATIDHTHPEVTTGDFRFQTNSTMADPGSGNFRSNTGAANTATALAMDDLGAGGTDITSLFNAMRSGDTIFVQDKNDADQWVRYQLTGSATLNSGWAQVPVTVVSSGGTITNNQLCVMQLTLTAGGGGGGGSGAMATDTLWDAAGDLAVGTGANTGAKLTVGSTGQRLAVRSGTPAWEYVYQWVSYVVDGGGSAIATGQKGHFVVPAGTIVEARLLADQSGSVVVDLWKDTYAAYPPVVGDSITASAKPTISTATKSTDATLTGWTTTCADGDEIAVQIDSCTSITRLTVALKIRLA